MQLLVEESLSYPIPFCLPSLCTTRESDLEGIIERYPHIQHEHRLVEYIRAGQEH